jgi:hypothetical protein
LQGSCASLTTMLFSCPAVPLCLFIIMYSSFPHLSLLSSSFCPYRRLAKELISLATGRSSVGCQPCSATWILQRSDEQPTVFAITSKF